jgi:hypothetical protein
MRLRNEIAIEVEVTFDTGEIRWCYFMTPQALGTCGDLLEGTDDVRVHPGAPHMIVASTLDRGIIGRALAQLDRDGELYAHTAPYT